MKVNKFFTEFTYMSKRGEDFSNVEDDTSQDFYELKDIVKGRVVLSNPMRQVYDDDYTYDKLDLADIDPTMIKEQYNKELEDVKVKSKKPISKFEVDTNQSPAVADLVKEGEKVPSGS